MYCDGGFVAWAIGAAVGLGVGVVVGGTLGRVFMRIVFLAQDDAIGL